MIAIPPIQQGLSQPSGKNPIDTAIEKGFSLVNNQANIDEHSRDFVLLYFCHQLKTTNPPSGEHTKSEVFQALSNTLKRIERNDPYNLSDSQCDSLRVFGALIMGFSDVDPALGKAGEKLYDDAWSNVNDLPGQITAVLEALDS